MAQKTTINQSEAGEILSQFGFYDIATMILLEGGSENTNYLVSSSEGVKLCEQKSERQANELTSLLQYLENHNFRTSRILCTKDDETVVIWKQKPVMVRVFLEGRIENDMSPFLLEMLGKELAALHQITPPDYLPIQLNYGKEQFSTVKNYAPYSDFHLWLIKVQEYLNPYLNLDLPKSIVHSDVFWDNVVVAEGNSSITIMDFEEAVQYTRIFDIGMTIIGTCSDDKIVNLEKVKYLLRGYQDGIKLSSDEVFSLKAYTIYAGASMTFWRHQNYNCINPEPRMFNHYLGLKVLVDYLLELDEDCFVSIMNNLE